ncbi:MAG: hypothetical protein A2729_02200 [Candidatus Buchananbacteria bacterium RIFCSPHIGHO2_01_FULL_39_14]|uniref:POTRA domain-containing protein n=1 Tax=Candidatus Buchananbacteria bacterium RIFCSPHIGHO2_01_FULL_39_14 TaxID=1797532 RepID=A0A1G1XWR7_9BACT|nr:MAG: hypothetical protein A2729_02200 [Candidatus Buchananbacteria bacterium RIFCSPHIGHO2_01_FULL_39_14]OGY48221.1 MAG: hypothetical protein A3D39_03805 [Candidatus Buchananbacteria bacterium RIFCSPHIGHO2_02_FULL_39_17]
MRRDYQKKSYFNPYFPQRRKKKAKKKWLLVLILMVLFFLGVFSFSRLPDWQIKNIEVFGTEFINQDDIQNLILHQLEKKRFFIFSQKNILFFSKWQAMVVLNKNYLFEDLEIDKKYFDTLRIKIKEKVSTLIWISGENKYYLDLTGKVIKAVENNDLIIKKTSGETQVIRPALTLGQYPIIYDQSQAPVKIGQNAINQDLVEYLVALHKEADLSPDFEVSYYEFLKSDFSEVNLVTRDGWQAKFLTNDNPKNQIHLLTRILLEKVKDPKKLQYIDLRLGEKVFLK